MYQTERYQPRNVLVSNSTLGTILLLATEAMFFAGMIASYVVNRFGSTIAWPPPGQPRLPVETTAFNTMMLLLSGVTMFMAIRTMNNEKANIQPRVKTLLITTFALGAFFVIFQGFEWVSLIGFGLTTTSSIYGGFFYTIIGAHAIHAVAGLIGLALLTVSYLRAKNENEVILINSRLKSKSLYWYFVVGVWPLLYYLVYIL